MKILTIFSSILIIVNNSMGSSFANESHSIKLGKEQTLTPENIDSINWDNWSVGDQFLFDFEFRSLKTDHIDKEEHTLTIIHKRGEYFYFDKLYDNGKLNDRHKGIKAATLFFYLKGKRYDYDSSDHFYSHQYKKCDPFIIGKCIYIDSLDRQIYLEVAYEGNHWIYTRKFPTETVQSEVLYDKQGMILSKLTNWFDKEGEHILTSKTVRKQNKQAIIPEKDKVTQNLIGIWAMQPIITPRNFYGIANVTEYHADGTYHLYNFKCRGRRIERDPSLDSKGDWDIEVDAIITTPSDPNELAELKADAEEFSKELANVSPSKRAQIMENIPKEILDVLNGSSPEGNEKIISLTDRWLHSVQNINGYPLSMVSTKVNAIEPNCKK